MTTPTISIPISKDGAIIIPKKFRKALKITESEGVTLTQVKSGILIKSAARLRAEAIIMQANENVARRAGAYTAESARAKYQAATEAIRKSLREN
ncbi:MAG: AbrB/MazE/SpoVT family DNA-binding domain-containing protein [Chloroflexota bacterium]